MLTTWVVMMTALLSTGGNDLLDYLPTANYWKAKNVVVSVETMTEQLKAVPAADVAQLLEDLGSPQPSVRDQATGRIRALGPAAVPALKDAAQHGSPEIVGKAKSLIDEIQTADKAASVRRLIAIRTLGELKDAKALPVLQLQTQSSELFIADYASAAIAAINGTPYSRPGATPEELKSDPLLLPANCGIVAQANVGSLPPHTLTAESLPKVPGQDPAALLEKFVPELIELAEQTGNVRLQSVTLGVCDKVGEEAGFGIVMVRGLYDPKALAHFLKAETHATAQVSNGVDVVTFDDGDDNKPRLLLPSRSRLILCGAASEKENPAPGIIKSIKDGSAPLKANKEMVALMASIDTSLPLWGVAKMSDSYRVIDVLAPFDTITLQGHVKDGDLPFQFTGTGSNADRVKQSLQRLEGMVKEASGEMRGDVGAAIMLSPITSFLDHLQLKADGAKATLDGTLPNPRKLPLALPMLLGGGPMSGPVVGPAPQPAVKH